MDTIRAFFPKIRALFLFFKKGRGGLSALPPLVARLIRLYKNVFAILDNGDDDDEL